MIRPESLREFLSHLKNQEKDRSHIYAHEVHDTDLAACPSGSIIRGHLSHFMMMVPFSIEWVSLGRPWTCHSWIY